MIKTRVSLLLFAVFGLSVEVSVIAQVTPNPQTQPETGACKGYKMPIIKPDESIDYKTPVRKPPEGIDYKMIVINPCPMDTLAGNLTPPPNRGFGLNPRLTTPGIGPGTRSFEPRFPSPQWRPPSGGSGTLQPKLPFQLQSSEGAEKSKSPSDLLRKFATPVEGKKP
jgi:hypothetical protein